MKTTKIISLVLALVMCFALFAGCSNDDENTTPSATPTATDGTGDGDNPDATPQPVEFSLPLVDELTTVTAWRGWNSAGLTITDPNEIAANAWFEEQTNVHIEWEAVSSSIATEQFGIMVASLDYCDMITAQPSTYVGGVDKAISDEVYIDASPYLYLMPNFAALRDGDPTIHKDTTTDSGNVFITNITTGEIPVWNGPMYYKTWADDLGYDSIDTLDDLHSFLSDVRDVKGVSGGMLMDIASEKSYYSFCTAFNSTYEFYQVDGQVKFGPVETNFRDMLETLALWYSENLINQDNLITLSDMMAPVTLYSQQQLAYLCNGYSGYAFMMPSISGIDGEFMPAPYVVREEGQRNHFRYTTHRAGSEGGIFVTTAAVTRGTQDLCFRWIDARFSEECYRTLVLGIQGEDWDIDENGEIYLTEDFVQKSAENGQYGFERADRLVACLDMHDRDAFTEKSQGTEWLTEAKEIWPETADADWVLPPTTLTSEEASEYSKYYTDISTYVDEFSLGVITGTTTLDDASWEGFINQLSTIGLDTCIQLQQAALDRYNSR